MGEIVYSTRPHAPEGAHKLAECGCDWCTKFRYYMTPEGEKELHDACVRELMEDME